MPWKETGSMDERNRFVHAYFTGMFSVTELCREYEVSRKTAYKWIARFEGGGLPALADASRAPHTCPHKFSAVVQEELRSQRTIHPHWGARKLLRVIQETKPELADLLPAASTAFDFLKAEGFVEPRKRRVQPPHPGCSPIRADAPNKLWCVDFKGQFRTGNSVYCYPLTLTDAYARFILVCYGLLSTAFEGAYSVLNRLFLEVGLPEAIRSDNGEPFCSSHSVGGLSRLSVWWMKLGIRVERNRPGSPQDNPRHEYMHRILKQETARPPAGNLEAQQERFDAFRQEYNYVRPHEALDMQTPAALWTPPCRKMPSQSEILNPTYPGHMEVRTVSGNGVIKFLGEHYFVSEVLHREYVALEEVEDGIWALRFYETLLAKIDLRKKKLIPVKPAYIKAKEPSNLRSTEQ